MNPNTSGNNGDHSASGEAPSTGRRVKLTVGFVVLGLATYAVSLAATIPARLLASQTTLPDEIIDVSGTLWNGQAILKGGYEVRWGVAHVRSLVHLALDVDWTLAGADSALSGRASLWPDAATLSADGRAGWGLARLAAPDLPISCDGSLAVSLERIVIRADRLGAVGELRSGPSVCAGQTSDAPSSIDVPPLLAVASMDADRSSLKVTETSNPDIPLADLAVASRVLAVTIFPAGAELTKSLPTSGPITLEFPF